MNMRNTVQCSGSIITPAGDDENDDHRPAGFFYAHCRERKFSSGLLEFSHLWTGRNLERGERDEFCLHFSESTFCGFEVSII